MTDKPIIQASLVDVRNINSAKEVRLELRVPAEYASRVFDIFGWPTAVAPVPVAICPLAMDPTPKGLQQPSRPESDDAFKRKNEILDEAIDKLEVVKDRQSFTSLARMKQAGIRCNEPAFWAYLTDRFRSVLSPHDAVDNKEKAADVVRWHCLVTSRRELDQRPGASALWDNLEADFYAKQHGMH